MFKFVGFGDSTKRKDSASFQSGTIDSTQNTCLTSFVESLPAG